MAPVVNTVHINNAMAITSMERDQLIHISADKKLKPKFCIYVRNEYPMTTNKALDILLYFAKSYLCDNAFSNLKTMKTKIRSRLINIKSICVY
jgi:hypothetical protein